MISLQTRPTRLNAIALDFSLSTGIAGFWLPFLALQTEYSVDFVVVDAHIAERPRSGVRDWILFFFKAIGARGLKIR
jgi:hypothetical protein